MITKILWQRWLLRLAGMIFLLVAVAHMTRLIMQAPLILGSWHVPMWGSLLASFITLLLAWLYFRAASGK